MVPASHANDCPIRFGNFEVDPSQRTLLLKGVPRRLQDKPWSLLYYLVRNPNRLVTREELRRELWPAGIYVDFHRSLSVAVHKLRTVLDDTSDSPRFLETIPGHGYRFIAPIASLNRERDVRFQALLVILPFVGFSTSLAEIEHIADAFTEELTARVSKIMPKQLGVLGRTTAMCYKGAVKTVAAIGGELGVDYVVEGSIQMHPGTLRVIVQLIRVSDQCHVWTESVEHDDDNLIRAQIELADRISRMLATHLFPNQQQVLRTRIKRETTEEAYRLYSEARVYYCPGADARTGALGVKYLHEVIGLDPEFAEAQALLSIMYTGAAMFDGGVVFDASILTVALQGKQFAWRALELDPECGEANAAVAFQEFQYDWNWKSAERYFRQALELNPKFAWAHMLYAWSLAQMGHFEESRSEILAARILDPLSVFFGQWEGVLRFYSHDYEGAVQWLEDFFNRHPQYGWTGYFLSLTYRHLGRYDEAIEHARTFMRFSEGHAFSQVALIRAYAAADRWKDAELCLKKLEDFMSVRTIDSYRYAIALASFGRFDASFEALERAYRQRSGWMPHIAIDPELEILHGDPRWHPLVERITAVVSR